MKTMTASSSWMQPVIGLPIAMTTVTCCVCCRSINESIVVLSYIEITVYQHLLGSKVDKILPFPRTIQHKKSSTSSTIPALLALLGALYISRWAEAIALPSGAECKALIVMELGSTAWTGRGRHLTRTAGDGMLKIIDACCSATFCIWLTRLPVSLLETVPLSTLQMMRGSKEMPVTSSVIMMCDP